LSILGRRVMHLVEEFEQLPVRHLFGVKDNLKCLRVCCNEVSNGQTRSVIKDQSILTPSSPRAHSAIARVLCISSNISYSCIEKALVGEGVSVHVFNAPEATCGDGGLLSAFGDGH
jgi:hypothetical protein